MRHVRVVGHRERHARALDERLCVRRGVLAVDADDADMGQRSAVLVLLPHRCGQRRQLLVAARAPVPEEEQDGRPAVAAPVRRHRHLAPADRADVLCRKRRHRVPGCGWPPDVLPGVASLLAPWVKSPMNPTIRMPMPRPMRMNRFRGLRISDGPPGSGARGRRRAGGCCVGHRDGTLVKVVGDEYVARHGHEQHGEIGDGVPEDPHRVTPGRPVRSGPAPTAGSPCRGTRHRAPRR